MTGWIGNGFLVLGSFLLGYKWRPAFLLLATGEFIWFYRSYQLAAWDMLACSIMFFVLALRNYIKWGVQPKVECPSDLLAALSTAKVYKSPIRLK